MTKRMKSPAGLELTREYAAGPADVLAAEKARTAIAEAAGAKAAERIEFKYTDDAGTVGAAAAEEFVATHAVSWEYAINENGVAVRRYVARSAWEIDPEVGRRG
jgi:hypothetical protein